MRLLSTAAACFALACGVSCRSTSISSSSTTSATTTSSAASTLTTSTEGTLSGCDYAVADLSFNTRWYADWTAATQDMTGIVSSSYAVGSVSSPSSSSSSSKKAKRGLLGSFFSSMSNALAFKITTTKAVSVASTVNAVGSVVSSAAGSASSAVAAVDTAMSSSTQLYTSYNDILYASVRSVIMLSNATGFTSTRSDTQEIDLNWLAYHSSYSTSSVSDAATAWHEYRVDWLPNGTFYYVDTKLIASGSSPSNAALWLWNAWSDNGNTDSVFQIQSIDAYFNRTSIADVCSGAGVAGSATTVVAGVGSAATNVVGDAASGVSNVVSCGGLLGVPCTSQSVVSSAVQVVSSSSTSSTISSSTLSSTLSSSSSSISSSISSSTLSSISSRASTSSSISSSTLSSTSSSVSSSTSSRSSTSSTRTTLTTSYISSTSTTPSTSAQTTTSFTTITQTWSGASTVTSTVINGLTATVIIETPYVTPSNSAQATVSFTTITQAWTGTITTTSTVINGLTATVIVETPGQVTTSASSITSANSNGYVYVSSTTDSGTFSAVRTTTITPTGKSAGTTATVLTIYPTPATSCGNAGIAYAGYTNYWPGGQKTSGYPAFTPESYKPSTPLATGVANYIAEVNSASVSVPLYSGVSTGTYNYVIDHTFYLFARMDGYYSFNIPYTDDIQFVWLGSKAVSGWTRANANIVQFWSSNIATQTPQTIAYYLTTGSYLPVRVMWANGGGAGELDFNIYGPDGGSILVSTKGAGTGTSSPDIVRFPCDSASGNAFPAWGSET